MRNEKKVLILSYDFPPYISVGGLRPYSWHKYFKENELEPIVFTRQWKNVFGSEIDYIYPGRFEGIILNKSKLGQIYYTPFNPNVSNRLILKYGEKKFRFIRKMLTAFSEIMQFFLPLGSKYAIYKYADEYLKENQVDVIIATGDPFILFHYANKLSKKYDIPWIADYRDPWSHFNEKKGGLINRFEKNRERFIVRNADHITTVSEIIETKINQLVGNIPTTIITNGFDPEFIDKYAHIEQENKVLTFAHAGTIYPWHPLEQFLKSFTVFKQQNPDLAFKIVFFGLNNTDRLTSALESKFQLLQEHIEITPRIPYQNMIELLCRCNVMLLFNYYAFMGTKIYDYMGIKRKMVLCFENDAEAQKLKEETYFFDDKGNATSLQCDALKESNSGIVAQDTDHLVEILNDLSEEFRQNSKIACESINIEQYSRKKQVEKLAELIHTNF